MADYVLPGRKTFSKFNEGNFDMPSIVGKSRAAGPSHAGDDDFLSATTFKAASSRIMRGAACHSFTFINLASKITLLKRLMNTEINWMTDMVKERGRARQRLR